MPYIRSEEHTSELQSHSHLVCRLLLEKKKKRAKTCTPAVSKITARSRLSLRPPHISRTPHPPAPPCRARRPFSFPPLFFFFLKVAAPPELSPFPPHGPFRT